MTTDLLMQKQTSDDPAAQAFEGVREELALLHQAVKGMAADRHELVIPDYNATLTQMAEKLESADERLAVIADKPALRLTPEALGAQIKKAADLASQTQRDELQSARNNLVNATNAIVARVNSARDRDEQNNWLIYACSAAALGGILFGVVVPDAVLDRAIGREQRAASSLGMSMRDAGIHLVTTADLGEARAIRIMHENAESLSVCIKVAATAKRPTNCRISVRPTGDAR